MSSEKELAKQCRAKAVAFSSSVFSVTLIEAADTIERQAERIAELEKVASLANHLRLEVQYLAENKAGELHDAMIKASSPSASHPTQSKSE